MKKSLWVLVFLAVLILAGHASAQSCTPAPSGMIGWWPGDGNASDISGAGNDGTLVGGATFASGKVGDAFSLDGTNDYIDLGSSSAFNLDSMTLDAWVYVDSSTNTHDRRVISKDNVNLGGTRKEFALKTSSRVWTSTDGTPQFEVLIGAAFERVSDPSALTTGWHHLAGVRDTTNDRFELWVDGDLVAYKLPTVFGAIDSTAHTVIGQVGPSYNGEYFPSLIDEAEIFNRALSGAEVRAIFDAGTAGKCKTVTVQIDIKPGSDPNSINCSSKGVIPLAILTTDDFDATTVDPTTVALDGVNARIVGKKEQTMCHLEDVDGDGDTDMVCRLRPSIT